METWNAIAGIGAAAAAIVAVWAVIVAHRANGKAKEANNLSSKANTIAKASLDHQKLIAPPVWSQASRKSEHQRSITNNSGRHVVITGAAVAPNFLDQEVRVPDLPRLVEHGDEFAFGYCSSDYDPSPDILTIKWHFLDKPAETKSTSRGLF